jgi:hypothetical protein
MASEARIPAVQIDKAFMGSLPPMFTRRSGPSPDAHLDVRGDKHTDTVARGHPTAATPPE